ncbi:MAG: ABC-F family ATP-binding cassette domain-containing protein [Phycisphaerales bacterium]|nr:ABC-F family ATP-binding cassette domain-containing protein [Phycisphaerales bacterium]|tara:strand:- start:18767 stop:20584 length:1818 start_codon:yes stop_codon:yes gene_type:complete
MGTILSASDITKAFPANVLFEGVSLHMEDGDRVGMIGPNGAGKSSLLKILAGLDSPDEGEVVRRRNSRMVYIQQDDQFHEGATPLSAVIRSLEQDAGMHSDPDTSAAITLSKLGFDDFEKPVHELSGGWRKRLAIACAIAREPDVLLLDEPTNHLDLDGVLWLESFVRQSRLAMIFVTHDRVFLENSATAIMELSKAYPGGTFKANGNYSEFLRRKEAFLDSQEAAESALANKVRRDTAWLRQGIQGRQTRNKTQVEAAGQRRDQLKQTRNRIAAPEQRTAIDFQATERKTNKLLGLHGVTKSMGDKMLFESLEVMLSPGQRIGLLGVNGSGKTTLLRLMNEELAPDAGTIKKATDLRVVTFSQHRSTLDLHQTLQEALCPVGDMVEYRGKMVHVTGWAKRFLFEPDQLATTVGNLSGGEQARLLIANLMLTPADVLLLDEPTNDLDIPSMEVLELALLEFPGAIVLVTHDRFMLERIATEYLGIDGHGGARIHQTYEQWTKARSMLDDRTQAAVKPVRSASDRGGAARTRKLSYKERREYESMEQSILEAEEIVEQLEASAADPDMVNDHVKAAEVYGLLSKAQEKVRVLYSRWTELDAIESNS